MIKNVVIQAGGLGERGGKYSKNKPKCLISINGKPLLFHLVDKLHDSNFYLIFTKGSKYVKVFNTLINYHPEYKKIKVITTTNSGNSAELKNVASSFGSDNFLLCWSDIIFDLPKFDETKNILFVSKQPSRWKIDNDKKINRERGNGIFGVFYFNNADKNLHLLNNDGSIMNTLKHPKFNYDIESLVDEKEFGLEDELTNYYKLNFPSRFYNNITFSNDFVVKTSLNCKLIERENFWYDEAINLGCSSVPKKIKSYPLTIEKIKGKNAYEALIDDPQPLIVDKIFKEIKKLHNLKTYDVKYETGLEYKQFVYVDETVSRINIIKNVHPLFREDTIVINGLTCINYLLDKNLNNLKNKLSEIIKENEIFVFTHGDPILSNILIDNNESIKFIDPRGYFCVDGCQGTVLYDFAKLYFSAVHNFDTFNKKLFDLDINKNGFDVMIDTKKYNVLFEDYFNRNFTESEMKKIKLLSAMMWIRFSSCVLDDYDSIIASISYGLYKLNEISDS